LRWLFILALVVIVGGGSDEGAQHLFGARDSDRYAGGGITLHSLPLHPAGGDVNATPDSILRGRFDIPLQFDVPLRVVAAGEIRAEVAGGATPTGRLGGLTAYEQGEALPVAPSEGGLDVLIIEATEHWGVEWAAEALAQTRFCESSNRVQPCVRGASGENGPYQFLPSTWATTPYSAADACDLETATYAAAWMVFQGRQLEFSCWPR